MRLGTRASALALAQARAVAAALTAAGVTVTLVPMRTEGDRRMDARLAAIGGKGLFVRELEEALLDGAIDAAVHSLKDLPAELPAGLVLAAFPAREDARDVLVTRQPAGLDDLPRGARVGTSSPRRRALALAARPDLRVEPIRGNVDTRLHKLEAEGLDAVILAAAGLCRLGLQPAHARPLSPAAFVPAVGQGILAVEARERDGATRGALALLDDAPTRACALAERAWLGRLGASCATPMGAHARLEGAALVLASVIASEDGRRVLRGSLTGRPDEAERLGLRLAETLLERGAAAIVALKPVGAPEGA